MSTQHEIEDERVWREILLLWKTISETPDTDIEESTVTYKNKVLHSLGLSGMMCGCPFCERYNRSMDGDCEGCPLQKYAPANDVGCYGTPYHSWYGEYKRTSRHSQEAAREFYGFLEAEYKDSHI